MLHLVYVIVMKTGLHLNFSHLQCILPHLCDLTGLWLIFLPSVERVFVCSDYKFIESCKHISSF